MRDWNAAVALEPVPGSLPEMSTLVYWARTVAAGHLRHAEQARAGLDRYDQIMAELKKSNRAYVTEGTGNKILRFEMVAWTAYAEGKPEEALKNMRSAADLQDKVGQGEVDIPAREMLADMLLELSHAQQALTQYEVALKLSPNRLNGLYNAGRAAEAAGDKQKAKSFYAALLKSTSNGANTSRPELTHAKTYISESN
jgi:tetratricopeptide (TPR) repeat protein